MDELTLDQIQKIDTQILLQLFYYLNDKTTERGNGTQYMERLQKYLLRDVGVILPDNL